MSSDPLLVGIDIGSTRVRALAFEADGSLVAEGGVATPTHRPRAGWAYHEPEALWQAVVTALRTMLARLDEGGHDAKHIAGVAAASVGESAVPLDHAGQPTHHAIAWYDQRTQAKLAWLDQAIGFDRLRALTGLNPEPIFGLCKMLWMKDEAPEAFARAVRWLHLADYVAYRLSGVAATDHSLAVRTMALDLHRLEWSEDLLREVGIPPGLLAPLTPSGTRLGQVTPDAARETGLGSHVTVAVGGHDHICGAYALGAMVPGTLLDSIGTAEIVMLALDRPIDDPEVNRKGYAQGLLFIDRPTYYVFGALYTAGASIEWFRAALGAPLGEAADYETLVAEAEAVPATSDGCCFLPHLRISASPYPDVRARGAFVGLTPDSKRGTLFRALLEGLSYEARLTLNPLLAFPGIDTPKRTLVTGGNAQNDLLMRIKASIYGQPLEVAEIIESTSLGAALLGGLGAGVFANAEAARAGFRLAERRVEPVAPWTAAYEAYFAQVYTQLYHALKPVSHAIHDLQAAAERRIAGPEG